MKVLRQIFLLTFALMIGWPSQAPAREQTEGATYFTQDHGVVISGNLLAFDGEIVTLRAASGVASFRANGMECDGTECPRPPYVPHLRIAGSPQIAEILFPALIEAYSIDREAEISTYGNNFTIFEDGTPALRVTLMLSPIHDALDALLEGRANLLLSARELWPGEIQRLEDAGFGDLNSGRSAHVIALDATIPITSADSTLRTVSLAELAARVADGQSDIHILETGQGDLYGGLQTYLHEQNITLDPAVVRHTATEDLIATLEQNPDAVGLVPYSRLDTAHPLILRGSCGNRIDDSFLAMKAEDHPLVSPLFLYQPAWRPHPKVRDFILWLQSPAAQLVVRRAGFIDLTGTPMPLAEQGERLANAIRMAGEDVTLDQLQSLVTLLTGRNRMTTTFRFRAGTAELDSASTSNLLLLGQAINNGHYGGLELLLLGFSDSEGPAEGNTVLSKDRAAAVKEALMSLLDGTLPFNVDIVTDGMGETLPIVCDDTALGRQTNRRVELWTRPLPQANGD